MTPSPSLAASTATPLAGPHPRVRDDLDGSPWKLFTGPTDLRCFGCEARQQLHGETLDRVVAVHEPG